MLNIDDIQPSQFYIDEMKLSAVKTFIHEPDDIVIQVTPNDDRYISLDGHTRLFLAAQKEYKAIRAVISEPDDCILTFLAEVKRRGVYYPSPYRHVKANLSPYLCRQHISNPYTSRRKSFQQPITSLP